ncbi:unnamed protein product [Nezara viridula]|uniref:Ankyrin repeat domain-containing protein n=1 Tax=Nezara viridula TaxID=85310 RepID=A0A9P0HJL6_NEZVI|nr:unnamed protein product [Nezara viridula]
MYQNFSSAQYSQSTKCLALAAFFSIIAFATGLYLTLKKGGGGAERPTEQEASRGASKEGFGTRAGQNVPQESEARSSSITEKLARKLRRGSITDTKEQEVDKQASITDKKQQELDKRASVTDKKEQELDKRASITDKKELELDKQASITEKKEKQPPASITEAKERRSSNQPLTYISEKLGRTLGKISSLTETKGQEPDQKASITEKKEKQPPTSITEKKEKKPKTSISEKKGHLRSLPSTSAGFDESIARTGFASALELSEQAPRKRARAGEEADKTKKEVKPIKHAKLSDEETQKNLTIVRQHYKASLHLSDEEVLSEISNSNKNLLLNSVRDGNVKLTSALLKLGASHHITDRKGLSPVHIAAEKGYKEVFQVLEHWGADINAEDHIGYTALHRAAMKGKAPMVKYLLEKPVDINKSNSAGWTAMHLVASGGHVDIAKLLVKAGANVNAKDSDGWTPLYVAGLYKKHTMEEYIKSVGGT